METTKAVEKDKAKSTISEKKIKVKLTYPENVPEPIRQEKINRIYDTLAKHIAE